MEYIQRIIAMVKKEFLAMLNDKNTRKILIIPIIVQSILIGYGATFNFSHIPYALFDQSSSIESQRFINHLNNNGIFVLSKNCPSEQCLKDQIDKQKAILGIYIQPSFNTSPTLYVIADARNTASSSAAINYLSDAIDIYNKQNLHIKGSFTLEQRFFYNENNITRYTIMTGMILALSLIQVLMLSSFSVSREKDDGTYDMMLMTPLNPLEILIAKAIAPSIVALLQGFALFCICLFYFKIPFVGNFCSFFTVLFIFSVCNVGLGLAISTFSKTVQQSLIYSFCLALPFVILSGLITPYNAMPAIFQKIALLNPAYYGVSAVHRIYLEGGSFFSVIHLLIPIVIIGIIMFAIATYLFRKSID